MSLHELNELLGPARAATRVAWAEVESRLGTRLPADYKAFVDRYGTGAIGDFLWVLTPDTKNPNLNLFERGKGMLDGYRQLHAHWPREYPFAAHPEPNGVLPWAVTDNGDELYWLTGGDPDAWPTLLFSKGVSYEEYRLPLGDLLAGLITGRIASNAIEELAATIASEA